MKRIGFLYDAIGDMDNLRLAFWKAQRGKQDKLEVINYQKQLHKHLGLLREQLLTKEYQLGNYYYFTIFDPKERKICAASFPERVLHHALMNICHPYFDKYQIYDSYASRFGKGTYKALARAKTYSEKYSWFLKLDFRKYFDSITHSIVKNQLAKLFKDKDLLHLFYQIIDTYEVSSNKGLPIGNLTSQYLANHYLASADHYAKEQLKAKAYVRYMDDIVIWDNDKELLLNIGKQFETYTRETLNLELKPFCLNQTQRGVPFLGYLVYQHQIRLAQKSKKRFIQKVIMYNSMLHDNELTEKQYQQHILPLIAFTEKANSKGFRSNLFRTIGEGN